ncbi:methyltransferase domain-containing protein [Streptomyces sp. NPDC059008]|uniref:methyltransferase domain-containing protein n=1 Tax=Streptomyces sp. NPDC059008 TaxID=3346693 RepID=UPI0036AA1E7E
MTRIDDIGYGHQFASFYDEIFPKDESAERVAETLAGLLPGPGAALELGVGTGRIALPLAARIGSVVGVDSSPEMLERLRAAVAGSGADVEAVHGDLRTYEDDRRYELVYAVCGTLSMLLDPDEQRQAVRRMAERLAPGGHLVIETHNPQGVLATADGRVATTFFVPYPEPDTGLLTSWMIDEKQALWQASHIWLANGSFRIGTEVSRLTSPGEVDSYADEAGLEPVRRSADWTGTPYAVGAPMYVAIYRKPN